MPTVLLLDVSLSMSRIVPDTSTVSPAAEPSTRRHLAVHGINAFLDHLAIHNKLEFVSLVIYSSLYERVVPFTRDYSEIRTALGRLEEYNKTCIETALRGVSEYVTEEWGTSVQCQVILITDGSIGIGEKYLDTTGIKLNGLNLGFRLHVICVASSSDPALVSSEQFYRRLISGGLPNGELFVPDGVLSRASVQQVFTGLCGTHYVPFTGLLRCGNLRCPVSIFPAPENYDREHEFEHVKKTVSKELDICGFLDIRDISNPPYISRHLVLPLPVSAPPKNESVATEVKAEGDTGDDKDGDKSAAFTVLLHGSLKVEQMVAIVQIGEEWFGMMYSYADSKKKSNLMLSVFQPGIECLPWLGNMNQLAPAKEFLVPQYSDDANDARSPFPVIPAAKRSYTQNCVVWIKNAGLQADIQKILRTAKRLPEKMQHFYKELNRLRSAALALGFYELLDAMAQLLDRECSLLPNSAHPDAALQMTHAANFLRHPQWARDASRMIYPMQTNFTSDVA